jgi:ADP-ribosylglycohydrolase
MKNIDKYRGCLIGGAAGDALGYAIEFFDEKSIFQKYGEKGITDYELTNGKALISDDTQMTLFTANGLLLGTTRGQLRGIMAPYPSYIAYCYMDWYRTQTESYPIDKENPYAYTWLVNIPDLFHRRAPGNTCMSAIGAGANGSINEPVNRSKGCGGVMRVAPVGLYFEDVGESGTKYDLIGAEAAAITHGHELGYIPAATLTHIIRRLAHEDISVDEAVDSAIKSTADTFSNAKEIKNYIQLMDKAVELSGKDISDLEAIHLLGQGWVAEEALAIAVYCALKYPDDIDKALIAAVNHEGDSDSTGAITGNIVGANVGLNGIPDKYKNNLELYDIIIEIADDLYNDCQMSEHSAYTDEKWESKYVKRTYPK